MVWVPFQTLSWPLLCTFRQEWLMIHSDIPSSLHRNWCLQNAGKIPADILNPVPSTNQLIQYCHPVLFRMWDSSWMKFRLKDHITLWSLLQKGNRNPLHLSILRWPATLYFFSLLLAMTQSQCVHLVISRNWEIEICIFPKLPIFPVKGQTECHNWVCYFWSK